MPAPTSFAKAPSAEPATPHEDVFRKMRRRDGSVSPALVELLFRNRLGAGTCGDELATGVADTEVLEGSDVADVLRESLRNGGTSPAKPSDAPNRAAPTAAPTLSLPEGGATTSIATPPIPEISTLTEVDAAAAVDDAHSNDPPKRQ